MDNTLVRLLLFFLLYTISFTFLLLFTSICSTASKLWFVFTNYQSACFVFEAFLYDNSVCMVFVKYEQAMNMFDGSQCDHVPPSIYCP